MSSDDDDDNENVIYDRGYPSGFGGINKFSKATNQSSKKSQQWLQLQRTYRLHKSARKGDIYEKSPTLTHSGIFEVRTPARHLRQRKIVVNGVRTSWP